MKILHIIGGLDAAGAEITLKRLVESHHIFEHNLASMEKIAGMWEQVFVKLAGQADG